jgi:anti-sigma regulatory factor (Ser/Thr protein kinase)
MHELSVPSSLESLSAVSEFVKTVAVEAGLDSRAAYRFRLAVMELVTNSITHGYCEAGLSGMVDLRAEIDDRCVVLTIEDTAIPYDPTQTREPDDLHLPMEERKIGGLGVYLVLQDVDSYRYEYVGNRNRSIVTMNRPAVSATEQAAT